MRTFASLGVDLAEIPRRVRELESLGFDGVATAETAHDPFFPLLLAAEHSDRLQIRTAIAVGFAKTPMTLAYPAHDLNAFSKGRFSLGLGSQIKAHITRRFSMPWSKPAARMREMVEGIKAIGASWYEGKPLRFEGEHYQHTLMAPMFTPTDIDYGSPPILVAAVGPLMTEVAAEVGDGLIVHSFSTESYIREVTLPRVERALARSGRHREAFRIDFAPFMVTGNSDEEFERAKESAKSQIAFYASTPAYRPVLDLHGWGEIQTELHALTKQGRWEELGTVISDEILEAFAVVGEPAEVGREVHRRFGDFIDDLGFDCENHSDETVAGVIAAVRSAGAA